jgi:general stress protein YciG
MLRASEGKLSTRVIVSLEIAMEALEMYVKRGPQPGTPHARRGGEAVKQKYGPKFYSEIGKKGGEAAKQKYGPEFYAEIVRDAIDSRLDRFLNTRRKPVVSGEAAE